MISFYLTFVRFFRATYRSISDEEFRAVGILTFVLLISGSLFYRAEEGWTLLDSFYFCVMTMTTIGYGDLAPSTDLSKIFTIIYAFISIGVFVTLAAKLATGLVVKQAKPGKKQKK